MKKQDKMVFGKTNLNKLVLGDFCVRTFIQLISSALECENYFCNSFVFLDQ